MTTHPTIAALKAALESERFSNVEKYIEKQLKEMNVSRLGYDQCWIGYEKGHEAATERLMAIVEKAVDVIEKYADGRAFDFSRTVRGEINFDHALSSATAKQFLSTLADAGVIKKESK